MGCGCQPGEDCGCHSGALQGYSWRLGAMDPAAAAAQVTEAKVTASGKAAILNSAQRLQMMGASGEVAYIPGTVDCAAADGVPTGQQNDLKLGQTATGLALQGVQLASAAGVLAAPFTMGISIAISGIVGLFSTLINHHAQAVKKEQTVLCSAVPAANNYLNVIAQAVSSGAATPQNAISALESLKGDFRSAVGSIYQDCNAACVMYEELEAICLVMESQFQDMIDSANAAAAAASAQPTQIVTPSRPNTTAPAAAAPASSYAPFYSPSTAPPSAPNTVAAPTGAMPSFATPAQGTPGAATAMTSDWLPIAALVLGGIFLLRGL
jgi:hypothetical protein